MSKIVGLEKVSLEQLNQSQLCLSGPSINGGNEKKSKAACYAWKNVDVDFVIFSRLKMASSRLNRREAEFDFCVVIITEGKSHENS